MTSIHQTPEQLTDELATLLAGASTDLQYRLGLIAGNSREHVAGCESPAVSAITTLLLSVGSRAATVISDHNKEQARLYGQEMYARQQAAKAVAL